MTNFVKEMEKRGFQDTEQLCFVVLKKYDECHKKIAKNNNEIACLIQENQKLLDLMQTAQVTMDVIGDVVLREKE
ncbi:hypothetical protein PXC01_05785 [Maribacter sp. M208]|uniref:hypothetical protein n=1 Tax=Maribacter huludaoensis TaxID=3030010 RepID=UPI0023EB474A|nr:hypothetical protein [Maribacter huludaoensis]MDF4221090.1 hypothetical protein [Maribacter huludaoensis]